MYLQKKKYMIRCAHKKSCGSKTDILPPLSPIVRGQWTLSTMSNASLPQMNSWAVPVSCWLYNANNYIPDFSNAAVWRLAVAFAEMITLQENCWFSVMNISIVSSTTLVIFQCLALMTCCVFYFESCISWK